MKVSLQTLAYKIEMKYIQILFCMHVHYSLLCFKDIDNKSYLRQRKEQYFRTGKDKSIKQNQVTNKQTLIPTS